MRKSILAVATAATVAFASVSPAIADERPENITDVKDMTFERVYTDGEGSSQETFYYFIKKDKDNHRVDTTVKDKDNNIVCDTVTQKADFMWNAGTTNCNRKKAIDVIKDISAYIAAISAAIGALFAIYTTAQKFIK
ncbi:hypothetical protein HMPREF1219_00701 [Corynebacterium pyruviciproducens ATCC BAA-1742]|uniref:Uncharacterized protein n=2 Tax=Corynebacterium pyruviciproducens TaxID=598660 RepID=S2ZJS0_9CORY|nr:hypothetical protein [Corynebacterium pyruviciproducens]EPD70267.1 hypothetical protein HMPREF1219_00701 [Corynebacterium pyruviciproducens ATCC BAA-1742]WOT03200.1 hypothetical protein CYJ47_05445 [Corynebacterium pyruviciproducens]